MLLLLLSILTGIVAKSHLILAICFTCCICFYHLYGKRYLAFFVVLLSILMTYVYVSYLSCQYQEKYQEGSYEGVFTILSIKESTKYYQKMKGKNVSGDCFMMYIFQTDASTLRVKDKILVKGEFQKGELPRNSGGFHERNYYYSHQLYGRIFVKEVILLSRGNVDFITKTQMKMKQTFDNLFPQDQANLMKGMILGDKESLSTEVENDFKNSGMMHLLAVSGTHVSYIVLLLGVFSNRLFGKYLSQFISIMGIIFYILLAGASPSVVRAGIMAMMNIISFMISRKPHSLNQMFFVAILILLHNPFAIYDIGFQFSFLGTIGMIMVSPRLKQGLQKIIKNEFFVQSVSITISVQMVLVPLMVYYFHTISVISILANLLIVPVAGIVIMYGIIILFINVMSCSLAKSLSYCLYCFISYMLKMAKVLGNLPGANILVAMPQCWMLGIYYLCMIFFLYPRYWKMKIRIFAKEFLLKEVLGIVLAVRHKFLCHRICYPSSRNIFAYD